jgi:DNA uptake protein ComE-like DNA-binding protein
MSAGEKRGHVPGIGDIIATRIIQGRPYQTLADLKNVEGLGPEILEKLTPFFQIP